jgi:hypothetical protein
MALTSYLEAHEFSSQFIQQCVKDIDEVSTYRVIPFVRTSDIQKVMLALGVTSGADAVEKLQSLTTPRSLLNAGGVLSRDLYRFTNFDRRADKAVKIALRLRHKIDVHFDIDSSLIYPEPKTKRGNFPGMSLFTDDVIAVDGKFVLARYNYADIVGDAKTFQDTVLREWENGTPNPDTNPEGLKGSAKLFFKLSAGSAISLTRWVVDNDEIVRGHATLAVTADTTVEEPEGTIDKIVVPEILTWKWTPVYVIVMAASAEAPVDFLPDKPVWKEAVLLLNAAIAEADVEDAWSALEVFRMLHTRNYDSVVTPLRAARSALSLFLAGESCSYVYVRRLSAAIGALRVLEHELAVSLSLQYAQLYIINSRCNCQGCSAFLSADNLCAAPAKESVGEPEQKEKRKDMKRVSLQTLRERVQLRGKELLADTYANRARTVQEMELRRSALRKFEQVTKWGAERNNSQVATVQASLTAVFENLPPVDANELSSLLETNPSIAQLVTSVLLTLLGNEEPMQMVRAIRCDRPQYIAPDEDVPTATAKKVIVSAYRSVHELPLNVHSACICAAVSKMIYRVKQFCWGLRERFMVLCVDAVSYVDLAKVLMGSSPAMVLRRKHLVQVLAASPTLSALLVNEETFTIGPSKDLLRRPIFIAFSFSDAVDAKARPEFLRGLSNMGVEVSLCVAGIDIDLSQV